MGQSAAVRVVGLRLGAGDDRARPGRRDRARPAPPRAPLPGLLRLLPHRRQDRQAVARLALRPVVRLRRARPRARGRRRDRGRLRRPRRRQRPRPRPVARRRRRAHDRPRPLPRLCDRRRPEAQRPPAPPRRASPRSRRVVALALLEKSLWRPASSLRWTAPLLFAAGAVVLLAIGLLSALVLAIFGNDRGLRGTAFGVAHAHYLLWGTALFALLGALVYWWPKVFGRLLGTTLTQVVGDPPLRRLQLHLLRPVPARRPGAGEGRGRLQRGREHRRPTT